MTPLNLTREDAEAVQRLRQLYPPHILASLFDDASSSLLTPRESVSSFSSGSARSSVSSSPKNLNRATSTSFTSSIPAIDERAVSPNPYAVHSFRSPSVSTVSSRPKTITRSVSDFSIREHALNVRSFPHQVTTSKPVYFCVHCGNGFEKRADWETHEWIFHERQSYWPCPQPGCQAFFDSGKAFEAHHQAVHGCGKCDHGGRVVQLLPERKAWACGFSGCKEVFLDWSRRCKHVSTHYETLARRQGNFRESPEWTYSNVIRNLLRQPELRDPFKKFMTKCHGHSKNAWPKLDWQPDKCAELQRCLEYRDFQRGIPDVIHLAYRLGHPSYSVSMQLVSGPTTPPNEDFISPSSVSIRSGRTRSRSMRSTGSIVSNSMMAPASPPHRSLSRKPYLYERKASESGRPDTSVRMSDTPSYLSVGSLPASPPSVSPPETRSVSPTRSTSTLINTEYSRPATATKKRMVARDPEVRGTTSQALLDFLKDGPPTGPSKGEHRARRVPRATSTPSDSLYMAFDTDLDTPIAGDAALNLPDERALRKPAHDFDCPVSPLTDDGMKPASTFGSPVSPLHENQRMEHRVTNANVQSASDRIQETVLELKSTTLQPHNFGQKILPPTPGPPPAQSLPLPPPPVLSPPNVHLPDTPTSFYESDVPPSPMPPGFTDLSMWPSPPPTAVARNSLPETEVLNASVATRPRTASSRSLQSDVVRLMPPPKRARSASRGRPRPLRWASLNTLVDPPAPSPGVDFKPFIAQPLDLTQSSPPTVAITLA